MKSFLAAALMVAGCGDNQLVVQGEHYRYVVSELRVPSNNAMARENGLDLNDDKTVDNQLGMIFGTLEGLGLGVSETATEALLRGGAIILADLQTPEFHDSELSGFTTYLGGDPVPPPCLDPARLDTCGQHLHGQGQFSVEQGSESDQAVGPIVDGVFRDSVGILPVEIAIDVTGPIRLDLRHARVRLTQISETHASGVLGGGLTKADISGVVIPQAAAQMDRIVSTECRLPTCDCGPSSRADLLKDNFDTNHDCRIQVSEVANSRLVQGLLATDLRIDGQDLLSFGVGIELAAATFEAP